MCTSKVRKLLNTCSFPALVARKCLVPGVGSESSSNGSSGANLSGGGGSKRR